MSYWLEVFSSSAVLGFALFMLVALAALFETHSHSNLTTAREGKEETNSFWIDLQTIGLTTTEKEFLYVHRRNLGITTIQDLYYIDKTDLLRLVRPGWCTPVAAAQIEEKLREFFERKPLPSCAQKTDKKIKTVDLCQ